MRLLLDSCAFLWLIWDESELSERAWAAIADGHSEVFLIAVSL